MAKLPVNWKYRIARLVERPFLGGLMRGAVHLTVPRHRVGVALVVMGEAEQVLMLRHVFHPSAPWGLPGGWLNRRESPADCALRELQEETGLTAVLDSILCVERQPGPPHLDIAYLAHLHGGSLKLNAEILETGWFPFNGLPKPLLPFHQAALAAARRQGACTL